MKRKLPLLLVVLMLLSMAYVPAAYAAPSAGRNDDEIDIADDDVPLVELPTVDIVPEVTVDQNGTAAVEVGKDQIMDAIQSVIDGDAVRISIAATDAPAAEDGAAPVPMVASPLAGASSGSSNGGSSGMTCVLIGLVLAAGVAGGVMFKRRQNSETR